MAPIIPIFAAIGGALTAGAATGTAAVVVGGAATALAAGGVAATAYSAGKNSGVKKATNSMLSQRQQLTKDKASLDSGGDTGTSAARSKALYFNDSAGVLGNASVGRRQLLAT